MQAKTKTYKKKKGNNTEDFFLNEKNKTRQKERKYNNKN